jgi:hypothetical protein
MKKIIGCALLFIIFTGMIGGGCFIAYNISGWEGVLFLFFVLVVYVLIVALIWFAFYLIEK